MADSPEKIDANLREVWTRLADQPGRVNKRLSKVGMSKDELISSVQNYRVDEQVEIYRRASVENVNAGCLSTFTFIGGVVLLIVGLSLRSGCKRWDGSQVVGCSGGSETWIGVAGILIALSLCLIYGIKQKGFGHSVETEFEEIALDLLKYASPDDERQSNPPTRYIADANDAEHAAADFMQWLGFLDAQATPVGPDGGVDVWSSDAIGQVKDYGKPIGRPEVQQHLGVAVGEGNKLPIFFARSGYTPQALEWADERNMPLYEFDLAGSWKVSNLAAQRLWISGAEIFLETHGLEKQRTDQPTQMTSSVESAEDLYLSEPAVMDSQPDQETLEVVRDESGGLRAQLRELSDLRDSGALSEDEFRAAKKKLLD